MNAAKEAWWDSRNANPGRPKQQPPPRDAGAPCSRGPLQGQPRSRGTSTSSQAPRGSGPAQVLAAANPSRNAYRIEATAVLLTYQGFRGGVPQWQRFNTFVKARAKGWKVLYWCTTLETNKDGTPHCHLMIQFRKHVDHTACRFKFEGIPPNVRQGDYLEEGWCKKRMQQSIDRGFFYVWANKIGTMRDDSGTLCVDANY